MAHPGPPFTLRRELRADQWPLRLAAAEPVRAVTEAYRAHLEETAPIDPSTGVRESTRVRERLTRRELEILRLVAEGYPNQEVAKILWVTDQTIKFHLANTYKKLNVRNRVEASHWAIAAGLVHGADVPEEDEGRDLDWAGDLWRSAIAEDLRACGVSLEEGELPGPGEFGLTLRQCGFLRLFALGLSRAEIATRSNCSEQQVNDVFRNLIAKLRAYLS